jgi:type I restriction enzyme S subunit
MSLRGVRTIGELAQQGTLEFGDGYRTKRSEHGASGYRIVRVADIRDGLIQLDGPDFVSRDLARSIGGKAGLPGDILLTTKGTVGRVAIVPEIREDIVYSPQLCYFRVRDAEAIDPRYLSLWFSSEEFVHQASHRMNNTDMAAYINLADIRSLELRLPEISEQRAIAEVLGALDDKIAANTKLALIADEWVRARFDALSREAIETRPVAELVSLRRDQVRPESFAGDDVLYVGLEHVPRRSMWLGEVGTSADVTSHKSRFEPGDILFGKLRPYFHKVVTSPHRGVCSTDILVLTPKDPKLAGIALAAVASDSVVRDVTSASEGTRMPRTNWKDLASVEVPWPGSGEALTFSADVSAVRDGVESRLAENRYLAATRDALLPQLMSGKLRVKDAEKVLEGVL